MNQHRLIRLLDILSAKNDIETLLSGLRFSSIYALLSHKKSKKELEK